MVWLVVGFIQGVYKKKTKLVCGVHVGFGGCSFLSRFQNMHGWFLIFRLFSQNILLVSYYSFHCLIGDINQVL